MAFHIQVVARQIAIRLRKHRFTLKRAEQKFSKNIKLYVPNYKEKLCSNRTRNKFFSSTALVRWIKSHSRKIILFNDKGKLRAPQWL